MGDGCGFVIKRVGADGVDGGVHANSISNAGVTVARETKL
jgi:hypothetical protein